MKWLLDTNAFSEPGRPRPDAEFLRWFDASDEEDMVLSVITIGEMDKGIALLPDGRRRRDMESVNRGALLAFGGHVLPIDLKIARLWGGLAARLRGQGFKFGAADELIAATALHHGLTVVTRDVLPFQVSGCKLLSPWSS